VLTLSKKQECVTDVTIKWIPEYCKNKQTNKKTPPKPNLEEEW